ncbi:hypothetical protein [Streptomyces sp. NPDC002540]
MTTTASSFLRRAGIPVPETLNDNLLMVEWQGGRAHRWDAV